MIFKTTAKLYPGVTIGYLLITVICSLLLPSNAIAQKVSVAAKLSEIEKQVNVLWKKTHQFESECPSEENAAISKKIIDELETTRREKPRYNRMDQILFLLAQAKTIMAVMCNCYSDQADYCRTRGEKEYGTGFGFDYIGAEYEDLIRRFPKSPYLKDAMFYYASDKAHAGECESDMNCHLHRSIDAFSPFIKKYPTDPKARIAVDDINLQLRRVTRNSKESGLWEIFDIADAIPLIKKYHSVVAGLPDTEMRAESLYLLARAFISVGQFKTADQIYNDLESHYPKHRNAKSRAAYLVIDYSENIPAENTRQARGEAQHTARLTDSSEKNRLKALEEIKNANINERPLLFSLLMTMGNLSEKDISPIVRKRAIEIIGNLAPQTSFFRSVVGYCLVYDPDKKNRYYCADLGINHPDLKSVGFYGENSDRINKIISEATGKTYPSKQLLEEWQNTYKAHDCQEKRRRLSDST